MSNVPSMADVEIKEIPMNHQDSKHIKRQKISPLHISWAVLFMILIMEITNQSSPAVYSFVESLNYEISCAGAYFCGNEVAQKPISESFLKSTIKLGPPAILTTKKPVILGKANSQRIIDIVKKQEVEKGLRGCSDNKPQTPFQPIIHKAATQYEVEPEIIKAIIMAESSFNPKAVSHKGAQGLMQLMPNTAEYLGVKDSFNPEHNIDGGVRYFKKLLDRFEGDVTLALAAYNAGSRNVLRYKGVPPFKATKVYIKKVLHYYETYKAA